MSELERERMLAEAWRKACEERDAALARVTELEHRLNNSVSRNISNTYFQRIRELEKTLEKIHARVGLSCEDCEAVFRMARAALANGGAKK